jgi:uncharacterized protein
MTRLFFATDIHGSDVCWKKFLNAAVFYEADILVLGGDLTGKAVVPISRQADGSHIAILLQRTTVLESEAAVQEMEKQVRSRGYYPIRTTPDEVANLLSNPHKLDALFKREVLKRVAEWMALAEQKLARSGIRCFVCPGNDDFFEIDELIQESSCVTLVEGQVMALDDHFELISTGWANRTPWHTYREEDEDDLQRRLESMVTQARDMKRTVLSAHCPPFNSGLDEAPELDNEMRPVSAGHALIPVGSTAVRTIIEEHQPVLSLHGHIHEARGVARLGSTVCLNPGSSYEQGILLGAVIDLDKRKGVKNYLLTSG